MEIKIYTDGGSLNNPGPAASAFAVYQETRLVHSFSQKIGVASNNFAEYTALIKALEWLTQHKNDLKNKKIVFFSDSLLVVNQVNGFFKVKNTAIREFILKIRGLENELGLPVVYKHIPREQNSFADSLVKKALGK